MNFDFLFDHQTLTLFLQSFGTTLKLLVYSLIIGGVCAVPLAIMRVSRNRFVSVPVWAYTYVMRGTPMLVQVYLIYYGIAQLEIVQKYWDSVWPLTYFKDALFCVVLAFALNTCAYTAEMLAGAIRDTNYGEIEAAKAMGMSKWRTMFRIVLPSAMRRSLPAYSNEVIMMLQSTSVASVVPSVVEITGQASQIRNSLYLNFEPYLPAAAIYLVTTFAMVGLFKLAEKRWLAYLQPRKH